MSRFYALKVVQIEKLTPRAVAISLEVPEKDKADFKFKAGQYITIKQMLDGEEVRRSYSLSSEPGDEFMTIGVKKVEGGKFSAYANDVLQVGDILEVSAPEGRFVYESGAGTDHLALFAAGSGITPIMSIIQNALRENDSNTVVLLYGNQTLEETMYHDRILELIEKYTDRFFVQFIYSQSREDDSLFGRIEASTVNYITKNKFGDRDFSAFYICGPEPMMLAVKDTLHAQDISDDQIFTELFTSSEANKEPLNIQNGLTSVTVTLDDEEFQFQMDKKKILLDVVLEEDIDAPYSCQGGVCSTCIARVIEGNVVMEQNQILTDSEIAEGLILTCQSHPTTDVLKIDYDDV